LVPSRQAKSNHINRVHHRISYAILRSSVWTPGNNLPEYRLQNHVPCGERPLIVSFYSQSCLGDSRMNRGRGGALVRIFHSCFAGRGQNRRSAGFQTCCIADFQIGRVSKMRGVRGFGNPRYSPDSESGEVCAAGLLVKYPG
jgi:hypothetical protein